MAFSTPDPDRPDREGPEGEEPGTPRPGTPRPGIPLELDAAPILQHPHFFQLLVETMNEGLGVRDAEGRIVYANDRFCAMLGYRREELLGRQVEEFTDGASLGRLRDEFRQRRDVQSSTYPLEMRCRNGDVISAINSAMALHDEAGQFLGSFAVVTDVTERQRSEAALRNSEQRLRDLFDGVPVGVYRIDLGGRVLDANKALVELLGYGEAKELIGRSTGDLYVEREHREAWQLLMAHEGRVPDFETRVYRRDGSVIWVRSHTRALLDEEGRPSAYEGTMEDITDRKQAEERLRESEDRFRSLVQNTSDVISLLDRRGLVRYESPAGRALVGLSERQRLGRDAFEVVHPEDRPEVRGQFDELVERPGESIRLEYRVVSDDGTRRVCESIFTNQLDNRAVAGIVVTTRDVTDRKRAEERLQHEALHDSLTGLPNRVLFMDRLGHSLDRRSRSEVRRAAVLFIDLDRFKMVNDSLGHLVGDQLLIEVSRRLRASIRPSDTLARLGGDEFAVLLEDLPEVSPAVRVAERIQRALAEPLSLVGREVYTSASIGIALSQPETGRPEDLLRDADTAMYRAKGLGRAGYAIFDDRMHAHVVDQLRLETELRRALEEAQLEAHYQPIVAMETGTIVGFEALVRWFHPVRGLLRPAEFLPQAEESGLVHRLGSQVMLAACEQLAAWTQRHPGHGWFVTINLSPRQLGRRELVAEAASLLRDTGLPAERLVVEITERGLLDRPAEARANVEALVSLGVQLSLDDFGTGYSSLALLHQFPFSQIKLDRWLMQGVGGAGGGEELAAGLLALCRMRGITTIAEGVETEGQRSWLLEHGCVYGQGRLWADPLDHRQAGALLRRGGVIEATDPETVV